MHDAPDADDETARPPAPTAELDALFARLYPNLRRMARAQLRQHERLTLLDTTGLVHESFLRMARGDGTPIADAGQFMGYASRVMRFVVIDFVRKRHAQRRGGERVQVTLDTGVGESASLDDTQLLRMHDALETLATVDERLVRIVEMRCFGGLPELEIARLLGLSDRTVRRQWQKARLMLQAAME